MNKKYLVCFINDDNPPENVIIQASCGDEAIEAFEIEYPDAILDSIERYE